MSESVSDILYHYYNTLMNFQNISRFVHKINIEVYSIKFELNSSNFNHWKKTTNLYVNNKDYQIVITFFKFDSTGWIISQRYNKMIGGNMPRGAYLFQD